MAGEKKFENLVRMSLYFLTQIHNQISFETHNPRHTHTLSEKKSQASHKNWAWHGWIWCNGICLVYPDILYCPVSAPSVTCSVFMLRFKLFLGKCSGQARFFSSVESNNKLGEDRWVRYICNLFKCKRNHMFVISIFWIVSTVQ